MQVATSLLTSWTNFLQQANIMMQGQINFHLTGGVRIFLGGVRCCATKELTEHFSSSTTVVGYVLVVSHQITTYSITLAVLTEIFMQSS